MHIHSFIHSLFGMQEQERDTMLPATLRGAEP